MRLLRALLVALTLAASPALARAAPGQAKLDAARSAITAVGGGVSLTLALSRPVPWRVRVRSSPPRLILDFREVNFAGIGALKHPPAVKAVYAGVFRPGWSRLVMLLSGPMLVSSAGMRTTGATEVKIRLRPAADAAGKAAFAKAAAIPDLPGWALPKPLPLPPPKKTPGSPFVVVLDPGHGGIDPGAQNDGYDEKNIVLAEALVLRGILVRDGFKVVMTRTTDTFIPLETRTTIARAAGADVFLAIHADSLRTGRALGATVYTLAKKASDEASRLLAQWHNRADLLAGMNLDHQTDVVAEILMDMARHETEPKTKRLSQALVAAIGAAGIRMHAPPARQADFSVLKSPDIPSALLELGFISSKSDLADLVDPAWRKRMAEAIAAGLVKWREEEEALGQR